MLQVGTFNDSSRLCTDTVSTDIELTLDPAGDTGSTCWWGRQKPFCCNTPKDLNPFLPVSLDKLFPTLPPTTDIPLCDLQQIQSGVSLVGESNPQAFGLVVIDGAEDAVANLARRDGSHLEFLSCNRHLRDDGGVYTAQFLCMNDSSDSNCDDMHKGGLSGTIVRMPDDCGFATYAVAHAVTVSSSQAIPDHLKKRKPASSMVYDLHYSYDFKLAKRDAGDIFFRVDYSDSRAYYDQIVAADHQKRGLESRFWSKDSGIWADSKVSFPLVISSLTCCKEIRKLRVQADQDFNPAIEDTNLDILLYNDDGKNNKCKSSKDGFLTLKLNGQVRSAVKWGVTMVGTIAPDLNLEEAYSYFDSNPKLSGTVSFNGRGTLDIDGGNPLTSLLSSPMTKYEFSHPGIVSFQPRVNIEGRLLGCGQIDG